MQEEYAIEIKNATVKLEGYEALHDFSWKIKRGERWFVLGPNGAGKTTLVKLMLGLVWPLYGASVSVLGSRYGSCDIYEIRKKVAWASPFLNTWAADSTYRRWTALEVVLSGLDSTVGFFRDAEPEELDRQNHAHIEVLCNFFDALGDEDHGRGVGAVREIVDRLQQNFPAGEVEEHAGFIENHEFGTGDERTGDERFDLFAGRETVEVTVGDCAAFDHFESGAGAVKLLRLIRVRFR